MDYVCKVAGDLHINDIGLKLSHMEIIDLTQEDFKMSPRLRESLRKHELEAYSPRKHKNARRIKRRHKNVIVQNIKVIEKEKRVQVPSENPINFRELDELTKVCSSISSKMDSLISKLDVMVDAVNQTAESTRILGDHLSKMADKEVKVSLDSTKLDKLINLLVEKEKKEDKIDDLISTMKSLVDKGVPTYSGSFSSSMSSTKNNFNKNDLDDSIPMYIPDLEDSDFTSANVVTENIESEGTEDIVAKLKRMKNS